MFSRLLTASVGAAAITVVLLLLMNQVANHLALRDPIQYFQISDFIPEERPEWQLPQAPPAPQRPPERPRTDYGEQPRIDDPIHIPEPLPIRPRDRLRDLGGTPVGVDQARD